MEARQSLQPIPLLLETHLQMLLQQSSFLRSEAVYETTLKDTEQ